MDWLSGLLQGLPNLGPPGPTGAPQPLAPYLQGLGQILGLKGTGQGASPPMDPNAGAIGGAGPTFQGWPTVGTDLFWESITGGAPLPQAPIPQPSVLGPKVNRDMKGDQLPLPITAGTGAGAGFPAVNTRPMVGGISGPTSITTEGGQPFPKLDLSGVPPVPQYKDVASSDYSRARGFMDKAAPEAPKPSNNTAAILAGLARGAGSVDPTEAGSFARALANWGAGGGEAKAKGEEQFQARQDAFQQARQKYNMERGTQEMQIAQHEAEAKNLQRQVDFQNSKMLYEDGIKRAELAQQQQRDAYNMGKATIHAVPDGMAVMQPQADGTTKIDIVSTKPHFEHLEAMDKYLAGFGDNTTGKLQYILRSGLPPDQQNFLVKMTALKELIRTGYAGTAFGNEYEKAAKQVDAQMKKDPAFNILNEKSQEAYRKAQEERIATILYNRFAASGSDEWIDKMLEIPSLSNIARILKGSPQ